jgi:quercetin dioxygenase-like cupin family protein
VTSAALVHADEVPADLSLPGARVRNLLATGPVGPRLTRRLVDVSPGWWCDGTAGPGGELWFVITGAGRLDLADQPGLPVTADRALWMPPGIRHQLRADGPAELRLDAVTLPAAGARTGAVAAAAAVLAADLADCEVETTGDRRFWVLFGPGRGCAVATQFVGEIPAGRAPDHSHPYDELVLVLSGAGVLHTSLGDHAIRPGSCAHLPPGQRHCLENTGPALLRVLGVFHPADSPAAKNSPD